MFQCFNGIFNKLGRFLGQKVDFRAFKTLVNAIYEYSKHGTTHLSMLLYGGPVAWPHWPLHDGAAKRDKSNASRPAPKPPQGQVDGAHGPQTPYSHGQAATVRGLDPGCPYT